MKEETRAILILSLLSPFFAEILSGSTTPMEIIYNPVSFLFLWGYYGAGVLLFRELWVRKNRNMGALMLFGFAYGIMEEGVFIKSWFNPAWPDLGVLGTYGRIYDVNVVWAVWLTIFHGFMSIWVPIMVFNLIFPKMRYRSLISKRSATFLLFLYLSIGVLMYITLGKYQPALLTYFIAPILALVFIVAGIKINIPKLKFHGWPFLLGVLYSIALFLIFVMIPHTKIPFVVPIILGIPVALLFFWIQEGKEMKYIHALMMGALAFWLLFYDLALFTMGHILELPLGFITYFALLSLYMKRYKIRGNQIEEPVVY